MRVVQVLRSSWLRVRATRDTTVYHSPAWQTKRSVGKRQGERGTTEETDEKETPEGKKKGETARGGAGAGVPKRQSKRRRRWNRKRGRGEGGEVIWGDGDSVRWAGFMKDGVGPLSASHDSVLALVTGLKPRTLSHTHMHAHTCTHSRTHSSLLRTYECLSTEIEVTSHEWCCQSIHVAPSETPPHKEAQSSRSVGCFRVRTTQWPHLSWGQVSASASRPPWTSPAFPPWSPQLPSGLFLGRCQGRWTSGSEPGRPGWKRK